MTTSIFVVLNLILLESLLSVDNAAVLAVMVKDLPSEKRKKALKYGLIGAYVFRGLSLLFVSYLMGLWILKFLGGIYLIWLAYGHFTKSNDTIEEASDVNDSTIFRLARKIGMGQFWATVALVEVMDLAFSVDNVFAAVAMTDDMYLVMTGVFIGILAMRFVAGWFVKIMEKHPALEHSAFLVIFILGLKLALSSVLPQGNAVLIVMDSHLFDLFFSFGMIVIFLFPLALAKFARESADVSKND